MTISRPQWLTSEEKILREMWVAGAQIADIAAKIPRHTVMGIQKHTGEMGLKRPASFVPHIESRAWTAMRRVLEATPGMSIDELMAAADISKGSAVRLLQEHHGRGVYVMDWRPTARKPAALWALGDKPDAIYVRKRVVSRIRPAQPKPVANPFASLIDQLHLEAA